MLLGDASTRIVVLGSPREVVTPPQNVMTHVCLMRLDVNLLRFGVTTG